MEKRVKKMIMILVMILGSAVYPCDIVAEEALAERQGNTNELINDLAEETAQEETEVRPRYEALDYVTLGQYTGLEITVSPIIITEEDIDQAIEEAIVNAGVYDTLTEGVVENGDIANIDYEGKKDGVAFDGGTAQGYDLQIGSGMFIEGFEEGLVGAKVGDTLELNLTFPEQYASEELAGQDVVFTVKVNSIKRTPQLSDEVVEKVSSGAYNTIDTYKEYMRTQLQKQGEKAQDAQINTELMSQLYNTCTVNEYPQELMDFSVRQMKVYYESLAEYYGMSFEEFLPLYFDMEEADFEIAAADAVKETLQQELVLVAIADQEGMEVTDEEYKEGCADYAERMGYESEDAFLQAYSEDQIRLSLRMDEAMAYIRENAIIVEAGKTSTSEIDNTEGDSIALDETNTEQYEDEPIIDETIVEPETIKEDRIDVLETEEAELIGQISDEERYDFKKFRWGDTQEKIETIEGEPSGEGDMTAIKNHYVYYETTVAGKDTLLAYYFSDEGLCSIRYVLKEKHNNEELYIDDYEDIVKAITKKYGEPLYDSENWQNDQKKEYYADKKGDALCFGYLSYETGWILERTIISMNMSADNYDISTNIEYQSLDIEFGEPDYSDDF